MPVLHMAYSLGTQPEEGLFYHGVQWYQINVLDFVAFLIPSSKGVSTQILFELMKRLTYLGNTKSEFIPSIQSPVLSIS